MRKTSPVNAAPKNVGQNQSRHSKRIKAWLDHPQVFPRADARFIGHGSVSMSLDD